MIHASGGARGCGSGRAQDGLYLELGLSKDGQPVEEFLLCEPRPVPPEFDLMKRGVTLIEVSGITHIVDWIGTSHYPSAADYIEEVSKMGLSRKISPKLDLTKLTLWSRILCVHKTARLLNFRELYTRLDREWRCPRRFASHQDGEFRGTTGAFKPGPWPSKAPWLLDKPQDRSTEFCDLGFLWDALPPHRESTKHPGIYSVPREDTAEGWPNALTRHLPCGSYEGYSLPEGFTPQYAPALFAAFPIGGFAIIRGDHHEATAERTRAQVAGQGFEVAVLEA